MGEEHLVAYRNCVAIRSFYYRWFFQDSSNSNNSYLWLHNNRCTHHIAKRSYIRDRKGSAGQIIRLKSVIARALYEVIYNLCKSGEIQLVSVSDDGNNKVSRWQRNSNAYVDILLLYDLISVDLDVDHWIIFYCHCNRFHKDRCEGQCIAFTFLKIVLH